MRHSALIAGFAVLTSLWAHCRAQEGPAIHRLDSFMAMGAFSELDREQTQQRLSLQEIEKQHLDGKPTSIENILALMARHEKLRSRVEEPQEVRGDVSVTVPPNSMGDEAYTVCFVAVTYNGLALTGNSDTLVLVRPEKHPQIPMTKRPWTRNRILAAALFHLGYLNPDAVMRRYRDAIGTSEGHIIAVPRPNVLLAVDTAPALEKLRRFIDSEVLEAMGVPTSDVQAAAGPRPPSLGAIASREAIHFYLMTYARSHQIPLVGAEQKGVYTRLYPEANLWTNERGFRALQQEYQRIGQFVRLARESAGQDWFDPQPTRCLTPDQQRKLDIRFGLGAAPEAKPSASPAKKTTRRRR
jgi:hypothetical protein